MTFALIPAAGRSSRMGRPKLALPLGDRTVLEHVIAAFQRARVECILVVVGPHMPELAALAESAGAAALLPAEQTGEMRATVELGLNWLEMHFRPQDRDAWFLAPADHPTLDSAVIVELLQAYTANPQSSIVVPTFRGQRGHPALLSWQHVAQIRKLPAHQGLNHYLRQHAEVTLELPVHSADILTDLDTPADYEEQRRRWPAGE